MEMQLWRIAEVQANGRNKLMASEVVGRPLARTMLEPSQLYLLALQDALWIWLGTDVPAAVRERSMLYAQSFLQGKQRPPSTLITQVEQGTEPDAFIALFPNWHMPDRVNATPPPTPPATPPPGTSTPARPSAAAASGQPLALHVGLIGGGSMPDDVHADKLGLFLPSSELVNERPCYYRQTDANRMLWFGGGRWWLGKREERGQNRGWIKAESDTVRPPREGWMVYSSVARAWQPATEVRADAAERLEVGDATAGGLHAEKFGEYVRCAEDTNEHPAYCRESRPNLMLWWGSGRWWLGKRDELGLPRGWLKAASEALSPAEVDVPWLVYSGAERKWLIAEGFACRHLALEADAVPEAALSPTPVPANVAPTAAAFRVVPALNMAPQSTPQAEREGVLTPRNSAFRASYADPRTSRFNFESIASGRGTAPLDPVCKELYLVDADFQQLFKMSKRDFYELKLWKRVELKKSVGLF